jgi:hypothetical protein
MKYKKNNHPVLQINDEKASELLIFVAEIPHVSILIAVDVNKICSGRVGLVVVFFWFFEEFYDGTWRAGVDTEVRICNFSGVTVEQVYSLPVLYHLFSTIFFDSFLWAGIWRKYGRRGR